MEIAFIIATIIMIFSIGLYLYKLIKGDDIHGSSVLYTMQKDECASLCILKIIEENYNTFTYVLELTDEDFDLGTNTGEQAVFHANIDNQYIKRYYYPTSKGSNTGSVSFTFRFTDKDKMEKYLKTLKVGDFINVTGPKGRYSFKENGILEVKQKENMTVVEKIKFNKLILFAAGRGIIPLIKIIVDMVECENEELKIFLFYAEKNVNELIKIEELEHAKIQSEGKFDYTLVLEEVPENWDGYQGLINFEVIQRHCDEYDDKTVFVYSGPGAFNIYMDQLLSQTEIKEENIIKL